MMTTNEISAELLKLLYISSSCLGLWTCISTHINKRCPSEVKRTLVLFIGILLVIPINGYLGLILEEPPSILQSIVSTLTWCYGPLMLMLINNTLQKRQSLAVVAAQFVPFVIFAGIYHTKLEWLQFGIYYSLLLLQVLAYLGLTASTLYIHRKKIAILGSEFKNSTYHWLLYLVAGMFFILIYDNLLLILLHVGVRISVMFVAVSISAISIYISTIAILLLLQPNMFERKLESSGSSLEDTALVQEEEKPRNTELSDAVAVALESDLFTLMTTKKPHLDPEINLPKLAATLGISSHQLSELLNIHLRTNFYDYLNSFRFKEAVSHMKNTKNTQSATDIAFLSGFNNRNSFYRVFKDSTGLTPGEYRKQLHTNVKPINPQ